MSADDEHWVNGWGYRNFLGERGLKDSPATRAEYLDRIGPHEWTRERFMKDVENVLKDLEIRNARKNDGG